MGAIKVLLGLVGHSVEKMTLTFSDHCQLGHETTVDASTDDSADKGKSYADYSIVWCINDQTPMSIRYSIYTEVLSSA